MGRVTRSSHLSPHHITPHNNTTTHHNPQQDNAEMNVTRSLGVVIVLGIMSLGAEGWMRVFPKRGDPLYPGEADMADYLSYLRDGYVQDPADYADEMRPKRGRYGNKYADNKSYGLWISALNKAGNYKRGKRAVPFVPAMSPMEQEQGPFQGFADYSDVNELIPDKPIVKSQEAK